MKEWKTNSAISVLIQHFDFKPKQNRKLCFKMKEGERDIPNQMFC